MLYKLHETKQYHFNVGLQLQQYYFTYFRETCFGPLRDHHQSPLKYN
jgi:hypothetical protein